MISDRYKKYNSFNNEFIIHTAIFITISLSLFSSNSIVDFSLLTCLVIYLSKGTKIKWQYSLFIFLWGIYSDLIIGYPMGYSSAIFLFFLLLNQICIFFGIFFINSIRFVIFFAGLCLVSTLEHLAVYLQFGTNILIYLQVMQILFLLLFYYPINYLMKNNFDLYARKE